MLALVFPGQGSQTVGMGKDLAERFPEAQAALAEADAALGAPLARLCFEGPAEELRRTENTQPAILAVSIAAWRALAARMELAPAMAAGHSLGEYSALVAAGAIPYPDALRAVRARGGFMQAAVAEGVGTMAAVLGLAAEEVKRACADAAKDSDSLVVAAANLNGPDQTVISGHARAVERAGALCKERGAKRVLPLPVSAPFHCALMEPAAKRMAAVLELVPITPPRFPVVSNVTAAPNREAERIRPLLLEQITAPVRWNESVQAMVAAGVTRFLEIGPGQVLSGLIRRIAPKAELWNVEDGASLDKALKELS
jgi:[acyl-carrier-protein] S-malonyltransferase